MSRLSVFNAGPKAWGHRTGSLALCLEDQDIGCGIVRDVGFIRPLTRCRSGLARMVATSGGYRRASGWSRSSLTIGPARSLAVVVPPVHCEICCACFPWHLQLDKSTV
jgi:hypothetical protein